MKSITRSGWVVAIALVVLSIFTVTCKADEVIVVGTVRSGGRLEADNGITYRIGTIHKGNELSMKRGRRVEVKGTVLDNKDDRPTIDVIEYKLK